MAFSVSPSVIVREVDASQAVPAISNPPAAIAGVFRWGPTNEPLLLSSENQLVDRFGAPNDDNYETSHKRHCCHVAKINESFNIDGNLFTPIEVMHYKLPVLGFRVNDLTYITDAKTISRKEIEKIKGTRVLVINALRISEHISHFNLKEALSFINDVKPEVAYLTHVSHLMGRSEVVEKQLPDKVILSYDGLQVDI